MYSDSAKKGKNDAKELLSKNKAIKEEKEEESSNDEKEESGDED